MRRNSQHFDTQLEAMWAAFFDELSIPYLYKPQEFLLSPNVVYTPDFRLPEHRSWVEVTAGGTPQSTMERNAIGLYERTGDSVFIFAGLPQVMSFSDDSGSGYIGEICNFAILSVGEHSPSRLSSLRGNRLNVSMQYVLRLLSKDTTEEILRLNTLRVTAAMTAAQERFPIDYLY